MNADTYLSIEWPERAEIKVQASRFIAESFPVQTEGDVEQTIESLRKREYNATHHSTAFRIGPEGELSRYNDDGEPSGTAGLPILRQIDSRGLTNTLVVVTRYFGGTKLGTGGLIRAYGDAAAAVLDQSKFREHVINVAAHVSFAYDDTSPAMHTLHRFGAEILESRYSEETELVVAVRRSAVDEFEEAFRDALGGRGGFMRAPKS